MYVPGQASRPGIRPGLGLRERLFRNIFPGEIPGTEGSRAWPEFTRARVPELFGELPTLKICIAVNRGLGLCNKMSCAGCPRSARLGDVEGLAGTMLRQVSRSLRLSSPSLSPHTSPCELRLPLPLSLSRSQPTPGTLLRRSCSAV